MQPIFLCILKKSRLARRLSSAVACAEIGCYMALVMKPAKSTSPIRLLGIRGLTAILEEIQTWTLQ